jgi:hypothetical protein
MRESLCRDLSLDRFLHQDESHPLSVLWTPQRSDDSVLFWSDRSLVRTFATSVRIHLSVSSLTVASPFSTEAEAGQGLTFWAEALEVGPTQSVVSKDTVV